LHQIACNRCGWIQISAQTKIPGGGRGFSVI
jgi:hypothetical protein